MYYIYSKHVTTGREEFVDVKDTLKEAVTKIRCCMQIDAGTAQKDCYYYFVKVH